MCRCTAVSCHVLTTFKITILPADNQQRNTHVSSDMRCVLLCATIHISERRIILNVAAIRVWCCKSSEHIFLDKHARIEFNCGCTPSDRAHPFTHTGEFDISVQVLPCLIQPATITDHNSSGVLPAHGWLVHISVRS